MKKIFKISFFALFLSIISCTDATDIIQESELSEDVAFQTVADLQSGLSGVYAAYGPDFGGNGGGDAILLNDLVTDNFKRGESNQGQGSQEYNFIIDPNLNMAGSIWANRYGTINRINRVLRAYERIFPTLTGTDATNAEAIKGQLLAMRALCHFDLFEYFTTDYDNPSALSVIKVDFVPNIEDQFERNTVAEILEFVNDDITQSYDLLGNVNAGNVNFINVNVVKALQARVAIVSGNNTLAQTLAGELVAAVPLAQPGPYAEMFKRSSGAGTVGELIFSLIRRPDDNGVAGLYYFNGVSLEGNPFFEASQQLFNLYDDADVRKAVNFVDGSDADNVILIGKYSGSTVASLANDIPIFRSSEMLLIRAEAEARNGSLTAAATSIKQLRDARYGASQDLPLYGTLNEALTAILLERRKELAFEAHRYLDLKRLGGELGVGVTRLQSDADSFAAPKDLPANDFRFTLPIPQAELNANNVITQNPGYTSN